MIHKPKPDYCLLVDYACSWKYLKVLCRCRSKQEIHRIILISVLTCMIYNNVMINAGEITYMHSCKGAFLWSDQHQDQWPEISWIMVHQRNWWIHSRHVHVHVFIGSFDELHDFVWSEWSWSTDPDHLKGMHPNALLFVIGCVFYGRV